MSNDEFQGWVLVLAQGLCLAALVFAGIDGWPWSIPAWILVGVGASISVSGYLSLSKSFRVHPMPNQLGLQTRGLYRWIRNPMYLALLLMSAGWCLEAKPMAWAFFGGLTLVLFGKIFAEERALTVAYPEYVSYRKQTKRLIPFIW